MNMIEKLEYAQKLIWEVHDELRKKGYDSMLRYCQDYIGIAKKEIINQCLDDV